MTRLTLRTRLTPLRVGVSVAGGALLLVPALTAQAHVRVVADSTTAGSDSALTFRVPDESATAGTVKLSVLLPQDTPFLEVSTKTLPGWKVTTTETRLPKPVDHEGTTLTKAVRTVTWTAQGGTRIEPGQYQDFSISVAPLPASGTVVLPATQTYSDGQVVHWDQPTPAGGDEPEHPAPTLVVTAATTGPAAPTAANPPAAQATSDGLARGLGGAGLALAVVALVVAVVGVRRRPSRTAA